MSDAPACLRSVLCLSTISVSSAEDKVTALRRRCFGVIFSMSAIVVTRLDLTKFKSPKVFRPVSVSTRTVIAMRMVNRQYRYIFHMVK